MQVLTNNNQKEGAENEKLAFLAKLTSKNKFGKHNV